MVDGPIPTPRLATALAAVSVALGAVELLLPSRTARLTGLAAPRLLIRAYGARELAAGIGLLGASDRAPWLWARVAGDALDLATLLVLARPGRARRLTLGAVLGITCLDTIAALRAGTPPDSDQTLIRRTATIRRDPGALRALLEQPGILAHLAGAGAHVAAAPDGSSHWVLHGPGRRAAMWTMGRVEQSDGVLSWPVRRDSGAPLRTLIAGFAPAAAGTIVTLELQLARAPDGQLVSPLLNGRLAGLLLDAALHRFKALAEAP